jgi:hypothetical protein
MNERIKELALQAGVTGYFAAGTEYATPIPLSDEVQKFAELIVRECMEVTKNYTCTSTWDYSAPVALARHFEIGPNYIVYPEIGVEE